MHVTRCSSLRPIEFECRSSCNRLVGRPIGRDVCSVRRALGAVVVAAALSVSSCRQGGGESATKFETATTALVVDQAVWQDVLDRHRSWYASPGAVAVVRVNSVQWSGVSGTADLAGTAITDDTRFRIASITKPIVAVLVLDAVARGLLSLDDPIGELLPDVVSADWPITVRMLLDHTSGIFAEGDEGDLATDIGLLTDPALQEEATSLATQFLAGQPVMPSVELLVALAGTHAPYAPPGVGYHYSNINYLLAAMALERATGSSLTDLLQSRIVEPLRLRHTSIAPDDSSDPELRGYASSTPGGELVDPGHAHLLLLGNGGSGGIISTAEELLKIMHTIVTGSLLPPPLVDDMLRATPQSGAAAYGLGVSTYFLSCGIFYGHEGGIDGTSAIAIVSRSGHDGVVVALNARRPTDPRLAVLADSLVCDGAPAAG